MMKIKKIKQIKEYSLNGYKNILKTKWNYPQQLSEFLLDNGFEVVGEGLFSAVYWSTKENFVVKVNKGVIDQDFVQFQNYCLQHRNKHLPKFGKLREFENEDGDEFYVIMAEKLQPVNENDDAYQIANFFFEASDSFINGTFDEFYDEDNWEGFFNEYNFSGEDYSDNVKNQIKEISELLLDMSGWFNMNKLDLCEFNFMQKNGIVILIDPFGSRHDHPNPDDAIWFPEVIEKMLDGY